MTFKDGFKINDRLAGVLLFFVSLCMFLIFMSDHLEEWDSVQFALAIHDFDMTKHQPHPPGYPAYIVMAKLLYALVGNDTLTLTLLSAISGSLTILFTYLLARRLFNSRVALMASILLLINPSHFIFSIVAMNDVVSLCFIVMTSFFLLKGEDNPKFFLLGALIAGFGVGVRPQNAPIFMFLFAYSFFLVDGIKIKILSLAASIPGALIWLVPVVRTHGLLNYIQLGQGQFSRHQEIRMSFDFMGPLDNCALLTRGWRFLFLVLLIISIVVLCKFVKRHGMKGAIEKLKNKKIIFTGNAYLLAWLVIAIITQLFFYHLYISRYIITSLIPLVILFSLATWRLFKNLDSKNAKKTIALLLALCVLYTGAKTIHRAYRLKVIEPSPIQAANYIKENFNKDEAVILTGSHSVRHFQYYLGGYKTFYGGHKDIGKVFRKISKIKDIQWLVSVRDLGINIKNKFIFEREADIYPKHVKTSLYVYSLKTKNVLTYWKKGFSHKKIQKDGTNRRWCSQKGVLVLVNVTGDPISVEISMELASGYSEFSRLVIRSKLFKDKLRINKKPQFFRKKFMLPPGSHKIVFKSAAKKVRAPKDPRSLYFKVFNFTMLH